MRIPHAPRRVATLVCAIALLLQGSPLVAAAPDNSDNNPVDITFTKWILPANVMAGFVEGDAAVPFVGFLFASNAATNGSKVRRLEAMYEVVAGDHSFAAMMRGAQNVAGLGILDGIIIDGWRIGAPVHAEFQARTPADGGCVGAPATVTLCFEGTIHIGRVPTRNN